MRDAKAPTLYAPHGGLLRIALDPTDGYYMLGIREEYRDYFTVIYHGER
jgi:hypothetical protein